jgi:hypothetical protein
LGAPGPIFDLASFSFQVPIMSASAAKHIAATKHRASVDTNVLVFMSLLIEKQIFVRFKRQPL